MVPEANELYEAGVAAIRQGDDARAEELFRRAAATGHAGSALELGLAAERRGEPEEAERRYREAADGGDPGGVLNLAVLVEKRDVPAAMELYRRAWELGSHAAAFNLGRLYDDDGRGDLEQAATWYGRAAERGNAGAAFNLGFVCADRGDTGGMLASWRRAAELGHPRAAGALGDHHANGGDLDTAVTWFRRAVYEAGDEAAARRLDELYRAHGDERRAAYWRDFLAGPGAHSPEFEALASWVAAAAFDRQEQVNDLLTGGLAIDLDARTLTCDGRAYGGVTLLGSFSHLSRTWLWSWANEAFAAGHPAVVPLRAVREHGEEHGIAELAAGHQDLSGFPDPHQAATSIAITSGMLLGGNGVVSYGINDGRGTAYVHLDDPALPAAAFDRLRAPRLLMTAAGLFPGEARRVVRGFLSHHGFRIRESAEVIDGRSGAGDQVTVGFTGDGLIKAMTVGREPAGG
ncbi:tetratricopeptide repeat protein [Actinomadura kijaniata]|uniref:tetratricopeptide repeat protein n=1 Tax=Actinomadura kijaniata TaxID=46161 RepID=UPI00082F11A6|nr:tetratricopeptide repeat protein [Actinomadura kijaniata]